MYRVRLHILSVRLSARTPGFHPGKRGSIPLRITKTKTIMKKLITILLLALSMTAYAQPEYYVSYIHPSNDFTEYLAGIPYDTTIGNPCGVENFIDVLVYGDLEESEFFITLQNATITIIGGQNYRTINLGCENSAVIIEDTLNTSEVVEYNITMYPNPATDYVYIEAEGLEVVEVYNMNSQKVMTLDGLQSGLNKIALYNLSKGIYMIRVINDLGNSETKKLVIK